MTNDNTYYIDEETIREAGLQLSQKPVMAQLAPNARVFEYPNLENVFVMESDLYGNTMPEGSCFLAFYGRNGLLGTQMPVESLRNTSAEEIRKIVESNSEG